MREHAQEVAWDEFTKLSKALDNDCNGAISPEEVMDEMTRNEDLRATMKAIGIDNDDLVSLFHVMDKDGNGTLECTEFVQEMSALWTHVVKTSVFRILRHVECITRTMKLQDVMQQRDRERLRDIYDVICPASPEEEAASKQFSDQQLQSGLYGKV